MRFSKREKTREELLEEGKKLLHNLYDCRGRKTCLVGPIFVMTMQENGIYDDSVINELYHIYRNT